MVFSMIPFAISILRSLSEPDESDEEMREKHWDNDLKRHMSGTSNGNFRKDSLLQRARTRISDDKQSYGEKKIDGDILPLHEKRSRAICTL